MCTGSRKSDPRGGVWRFTADRSQKWGQFLSAGIPSRSRSRQAGRQNATWAGRTGRTQRRIPLSGASRRPGAALPLYARRPKGSRTALASESRHPQPPSRRDYGGRPDGGTSTSLSGRGIRRRPGILPRSAGAHACEDYPERDDGNWLRHTLAWREEAGRVRLGDCPVHVFSLSKCKPSRPASAFTRYSRQPNDRWPSAAIALSLMRYSVSRLAPWRSVSALQR
jgi:hypothetical protein